MAPGTDSFNFRKHELALKGDRGAMAIRMRTTLLLCLVSVSFVVVSLSLLIVHSILQKQIRRDIVSDLERSIVTFRNIQTQREQMLLREVSLLAALPVLKSLMTTSDERTIRDGAAEFYRLSGGDLFALADRSGKFVALFDESGFDTQSELEPSLDPSELSSAESRYVSHRGNLYEVASQPLYFGTPATGTRLGYVLLGYAVNRQLAQEVSQVASSEVIFYADQGIAATTLGARRRAECKNQTTTLLSRDPNGGDIWLGGEHFVQSSTQLSAASGPRVQLAVLKSYDQASRYLTHLNYVFLLLGACLLVLSGLLAVYLSTKITRPLDRLVAGARALGAGNFEYHLQRTGVREIQELGEAFARMRRRLHNSQQELLAAERLATIGRMASSVSHDLRHYLSAVYANAEFLGYDTRGPEERQELLAEVRQGVRGMTDMLDSLLLFSRTGEAVQLSFESVPHLAERSLAMVKAHPDAQNIEFVIDPMPLVEAWLDAVQIERAIYNLLLNGCQAARQGAGPPRIRIALSIDSEWVVLRIADNGPGVPESIRVTLFQPFISEGKQSGTGLGLTLAHKVAQEHGGYVTLEDSKPGRTVFALCLARSKLLEFSIAASSHVEPVATH